MGYVDRSKTYILQVHRHLSFKIGLKSKKILVKIKPHFLERAEIVAHHGDKDCPILSTLKKGKTCKNLIRITKQLIHHKQNNNIWKLVNEPENQLINKFYLENG